MNHNARKTETVCEDRPNCRGSASENGTAPLGPRGMALAAVFFAALVLGGCHSKAQLPSELYPVHGRVQLKNGEPAPGGLVSFQSQDNPLVTATGAIAADGTFTLSSFIDSVRRPGAVAGPHRVQITPPFSDHGMPYGSTVLPDFLVVKPGDNEFTLTVNEK